MQGELEIKVKELIVYNYDKKSNSNELRIMGEDGNVLYIVGENDWIELLKNVKKQNFYNYYGMVVEICFPTFEVYRDSDGSSFFKRGTVISVDDEGIFKIALLNSDEIVKIHGEWLVNAKTFEEVDMSKFENSISDDRKNYPF